MLAGLLGPNGAGKTTTIRILTTLLQFDGGRATVGGFDVVKQAQLVRAVIGLTGQFAAVDDDLTAARTSSSSDGSGASTRGRRRNGRRGCSMSSSSTTPPTARSRRTPAGCAGVWTSAPA